MAYQVNGYVLRTDNEDGIPGLIVEARDMDIAYHDFLGEDKTNEEGYFAIDFERADFSPGGLLGILEGVPDIEIKVFNTWGDTIYISDIKREAGEIIEMGNIPIASELLEHEEEPETMEICADEPTPEGWVVIAYRTASKCGDGIDNVKVIQKMEEAHSLPPLPPLPIIASNVQITNILYDGIVPRVESDEYVEITNSGTEPQDLTGWVLKDIAEGYPAFTFPQSVLKPRETIRVYTNEIHPLWGGFSFGYGRAIWNNKEPDTAALYNAQGEEISRKSY